MGSWEIERRGRGRREEDEKEKGEGGEGRIIVCIGSYHDIMIPKVRTFI